MFSLSEIKDGFKGGSASIDNMPNRNYDVSTTLRFTAITLIVLGHLGAFNYGGGGALLLMVLVGYNIASFKLRKILKTGSVFPIGLMIIKVAVPTICYTALLHLLIGPLTWPNLLLIGNFFTEGNPNGFGYWFIEVYVQIQFLFMLLLALPAVRRAAKGNIRVTSYMFVALASILLLACLALWDTSEFYNRLPWLALWMIAFGVAARFSEKLIDKIVFVALFVLMSVFYKGVVSWVLVGGYAILMLSPDIRLPAAISKVVHYIAAGSLFIYLTHFQVASVVEKLIGESPWVSSIMALILGASLFHIYNKLINKPVTNFLRQRGYVV